eukprot:TRINITY_DN11503_c0_g1_i1.p1 TRINITY_DN11503_c0_g1~~TRINITY_DN11503_c0_g1_i1.p1  ORF type:complete len:241 (-),score=40.71 TRINITY_DN11503_c0_g1_i1:239-961(-)
MTSFGRDEGHWLSDISPIAPLLLSGSSDGRCNLTAFSAPWAGNQGLIPWVVTLSLHGTPLSNPPRVLTPWLGVTTETGGISQAFQWVFFNRSFAANFKKFEFPAANSSKVTLAAYISGHGSGQHSCGEFCATLHHFTLNHQVFLKNNSLPDTNPQRGCSQFVSTGVVPNEFGTWLYGRDGWCNGHPVELWRADVTAAIQPGLNALTYTALWNGSYPDPGPQSAWQQAEPVMMVSVFVVLE